jgi:hypothetical protein
MHSTADAAVVRGPSYPWSRPAVHRVRVSPFHLTESSTTNSKAKKDALEAPQRSRSRVRLPISLGLVSWVEANGWGALAFQAHFGVSGQSKT